MAITKCPIGCRSVTRFTVAARVLSYVWLRQRLDGRSLKLMEKILSKTNLGTKSQQNRELRDDELDAATGGLVVISIIQPLFGLLLPAINSAANPPHKP